MSDGLPLFESKPAVPKQSFQELLDRATNDLFGSATPDITNVGEAYNALARKLGSRYSACTIDNFEIATTEDRHRHGSILLDCEWKSYRRERE